MSVINSTIPIYPDLDPELTSTAYPVTQDDTITDGANYYFRDVSDIASSSYGGGGSN